MSLRQLTVLLALCWPSSASARQADSHTPGHPARVAYVSDEAQNNVFELYSAPIDGSELPVRLNGALPVGGDVQPADFSVANPPGIAQVSGRRVLYVADALTNDVFELFIVPDDASAPPVKLSGALVTGGDVSEFVAGKRLAIYRADATTDGRDELFCVPLDGSAAPIALTTDLPVPYDVNRIVQLSRDERLVLFTVDSGVERLYVVPTDGSQPPLLLDDSGASAGTLFSYFPSIEIAPDGVHVIYATAENDKATILGNVFSAQLDGSTAPLQLQPGSRMPIDVHRPQFQLARNGQRVVFADPTFGDSHLYSSHLDGTGLVDLIPAGERAGLFRVSADSVYTTFVSESGSQRRLVLARLDGTQSLQLTEPVAKPFYTLDLAPGGTSLVYTVGDPVGSGATTQLYALHGPNQPIALAGAPLSPLGVHTSYGFGFTPGGERVVFLGDLNTDGVLELYSVLLDGSQPPQRLCAPLSSGRGVASFRMAPGGRRVVYMADQSTDNVYELFSVPADRSAPAVRLNNAPVFGGDVTAYAVPGALVRLARAP